MTNFSKSVFASSSKRNSSELTALKTCLCLRHVVATHPSVAGCRSITPLSLVMGGHRRSRDDAWIGPDAYLPAEMAALGIDPCVLGMALILGIDRFMSTFRATVNMIGNGVATLVIARWEREITSATLKRHLDAA